MTAIFRRDLRSYFVSPLGYVYLAIFIFITALYFLLVNVNAGASDLSGNFYVILVILILAIPILTMPLLSEEYKQKTDQLLLTAPVRVFDIVLGKFMAAYVVYLLSLALTLVCPLVVSLAGTLAVASMLGNYVALICAGAAFISIGLFMSSLTENQLISALMALGLLLTLFLADLLTQSATSGFVKTLSDIIAALSLFRRYDLFTRGIFSVADLFYYLTVCAFFLFLSARIVEKKRWS